MTDRHQCGKMGSYLQSFPVEIQALVAQTPVAEELGSEMRAASCNYPGINVFQYACEVASPREGVYGWHGQVMAC